MPRAIAILPTDLDRGPLGLPSRLAHVVAGRTVLAHAVARLARVGNIDAIYLVHPAGQDPLPLLGDLKSPHKIHALAIPEGSAVDEHAASRRVARRWAPHAWRGGLGGSTCFDELLPAAPLQQAMAHAHVDSALVVGADWMLLDPDLCQRVLALQLEHAEALQLTFSQAPPGLCGVAVGEKFVRQLVDSPGGTIGQVLAYLPSRPQADPIGRDVCLQVDGAVRSCARRFVYDAPRAMAMIDALAERFGDAINEADASALVAAVTDLERSRPAGWGALPRAITLELTPRRSVNGPITPQHHVAIDRPDLDVDLARRIVGQLGADADTTLTLGGLGDALLHPHWPEIVEAARAAGVASIAVETDLLVEPDALARLLDLSVDLVSIRLNADRAATYEKVMGVDGFSKVIANLQALYGQRGERWERGRALGIDGLPPGLPWLMPRMVKTADTLPDMETFFDKWTHLMGLAVIEPATSGCGLMPDQSPVAMAPPRRTPCRQLGERMTIHSDGRVARCDQDWLGRAAAGDARTTPLAEIWQSMNELRSAHREGRWESLPLCGGCREWHRP
ncbi:MAG: SPASM domain-containing protein [Planctomycetota bacterium]|nr:SPASM domain-containing protein [Planctomycetota bacterium]